MSYTLINFNIPNYLKKNLDQLVHFKRVSRTAILNTMIEEFCRKEFSLIKEDGRLNALIKDIEQKNYTAADNQNYEQSGSNYAPLKVMTYDDLPDDGLRL